MVLACELGFQSTCFETDCLQLFNGGKTPSNGASYFSSILADCRILVSQFNNVFVAFIRRSGNMIADFLARHASSFLGSVWIEEVLKKVVSLVSADVLAFMSSTV